MSQVRVWTPEAETTAAGKRIFARGRPDVLPTTTPPAALVTVTRSAPLIRVALRIVSLIVTRNSSARAEVFLTRSSILPCSHNGRVAVWLLLLSSDATPGKKRTLPSSRPWHTPPTTPQSSNTAIRTLSGREHVTVFAVTSNCRRPPGARLATVQVSTTRPLGLVPVTKLTAVGGVIV